MLLDTRVNHFTTQVLCPSWEKMRLALENDGYFVSIFEGKKSGVPLYDELIGVVLDNELKIGDIKDLKPHESLDAPIRFVAATLVVDRQAITPTSETSILGKFLGVFVESIILAGDGNGHFFAYPLVFYYTQESGRIQAFQHYFDNQVKHHSIEDVTTEHIHKHFLKSFSHFKGAGEQGVITQPILTLDDETANMLAPIVAHMLGHTATTHSDCLKVVQPYMPTQGGGCLLAFDVDGQALIGSAFFKRVSDTQAQLVGLALETNCDSHLTRVVLRRAFQDARQAGYHWMYIGKDLLSSLPDAIEYVMIHLATKGLMADALLSADFYKVPL